MTFLSPPLLLLSLILRPIPAGFVSEYILYYVAHYGSSSICGCALVCFPSLQAVSTCGWRSVPAFFSLLLLAIWLIVELLDCIAKCINS